MIKWAEQWKQLMRFSASNCKMNTASLQNELFVSQPARSLIRLFALQPVNQPDNLTTRLCLLSIVWSVFLSYFFVFVWFYSTF